MLWAESEFLFSSHPQHPKRKLALKNNTAINYNFKRPNELQPFFFSVFLCQELASFVGQEGNWNLSYPFYQNMLTILCRQSRTCKIKVNFWILQEKYTHIQFLLLLIFRSSCVIYIKKSMSKVNCLSPYPIFHLHHNWVSTDLCCA